MTVAFYAVFILLGPVVGGLCFWLGGGLFMGLLANVEDFAKLTAGALGVSIALAPLGMIQALITAVVSALLSRRIDSDLKWLGWTVFAGALASLFSLLTVLAAFVFSRDFGALGGFTYAVGSMLVTGAVTAAVCGAISIKFRPARRSGTVAAI